MDNWHKDLNIEGFASRKISQYLVWHDFSILATATSCLYSQN